MESGGRNRCGDGVGESFTQAPGYQPGALLYPGLVLDILPLAASWTANFSSWNSFANWCSNSNFASLVMGIVLPGAMLVAYHLGKVRAHVTAEHVKADLAAERRHAEALLLAKEHHRLAGHPPAAS